jgi:uncharacterized protein
MSLLRVVLDTNVIVSAALRLGNPHRTLLKARMKAVILASDDTLAELKEVLLRPKFDREISRSLREGLYQEFARQCTFVPIPFPVRICRDPRDNKFIELAVHGQADAIITGDRDLLALNPFRGIAILTPADYLLLH